MRNATCLRLGWLAAVLLWCAHADAEPTRIRMAAVAPEGTAWAHEFRMISREIEAATHGDVQLKWYLGGIAGDEVTSLERVRRGQLDGLAGAMFCDRLAPSLRVARIAGLFQSRAEWEYVMTRLLPRLTQEFEQQGFVNLGVGSFGDVRFFTRRPVRTLDDLKRQRLWVYDLDDVSTKMFSSMGLTILTSPLFDALKLYDEGKIDGFATTPSVALAFQWSARARYVSDLVSHELPGCFVIAQRALDALPRSERNAVTGAVAKLVGRFRELGAAEDQALLNGLFERQGLQHIAGGPPLRGAFLDVSRRAREELGTRLVPAEVLDKTLGWLADYRAEHRVEAR
jgi:TRAP-type transport system periplasmic protein